MSRSGWLDLMPGGRGERWAYEATDRYWDAVMVGDPLASESLDPSLAETIRHLQSLDDAPDPDTAFAARLEGALLRHASPVHLVRTGPDAPCSATDLHTSVVRAGWPHVASRTAMNVMATAALLAIIVASTLVAFWVGSHRARQRDPLPIVLAPGITDEKLLLQARFDTIPDGLRSAKVSRWVLQPGAEVAMGRQDPGGTGPAAYVVETGTLSVQPDVSVPVTRADATTPTAVPEAAWSALLPGDQMFVPAGVTSLWRNDGAHPVRILEATFAIGGVQSQPDGVLNYEVIDDWPYPEPDHPVTMSLIEVTLHPEGSLPVDTVPGLAMLAVESGRLVAIDGDPLRPVALGQATRFLHSFPPGRVFRSGNEKPVKLLLVTIMDANPLGNST